MKRRKTIGKRAAAIITTLLLLTGLMPAGVSAETLVDYTGASGQGQGMSGGFCQLRLCEFGGEVYKGESGGIGFDGIKTDSDVTDYIRNIITNPVDTTENIEVVASLSGPGSNNTIYAANYINLYNAEDYPGTGTPVPVATYGGGSGGITGSIAWGNWYGGPVISLSIDSSRLEAGSSYTLVFGKDINPNNKTERKLGVDVTFTFKTLGSSVEKVSQKDVEITVTESASLAEELNKYVLADIETLKISTDGVKLSNSDFSYLVSKLGATLKSLDMGNAEMSATTLPVMNTNNPAFTALENFVMSPSVTSIQNQGMRGCTSLKTVDLQNVTSVGTMAFYGITTLESVDMPKVKTISNHVFMSCSNLTEVVLEDLETVGDYAFYLCANLKLDTIPASVTTLGDSAFDGCSSLGKDGIITMLPQVPPTEDSGSLWGSNFLELKVKVPEGCLAAYQEKWGYYEKYSDGPLYFSVLTEGITLDKTKDILEKGTSDRIVAEVNPADADDPTVKWTSSDENVVTVDEDGVITAVAPGTATVTAETAPTVFGKSYTAECQVIVVDHFEDPQMMLEIKDGIPEIPDGLVNTPFNTEESIIQELYRVATEKGDFAATEENTVVWDVKLLVSIDGGNTWMDATKDDFHEEGLAILLPYPDGTDGEDYDFTVVHMVTEEMNGLKPGDTELPAVIETEDGLYMVIKSLSPFSISWQETPESNAADNTGDDGDDVKNIDTTNAVKESPKTGDSMELWALLGAMIISLGGVSVAVYRRRAGQ